MYGHEERGERARIDEQRGFVEIDFRGCGSRELSEIYQDFAHLCASKEVRWALLEAGDEDADAHGTLRDVLTTLAYVAKVPLRLRLALVTTSDKVERMFEALRMELLSLGCEMRVFRAQRPAKQWLRAEARPAPAHVERTVSCS